ncbi:C40 family peptidase [Aquabacterium sp.]|uniref:C40 family peptidase n=1 Tax=Aquabacterium sp. TaxID=1872578 RepID=UPI003436914F
MVFTIRRQGPAQVLGDPAPGIPSGVHTSFAAGLLACGLMLGAASSASAQAVSTATQPGTANITTTQGSAAPAPAANATPVAATDNTDPVSRFLADKGLLPNTKPVVELAQQVRDKATDMASELVLSAMNFLGVPYRRGGSSAQSGFDCSGFTRHVFENSVGLILPRRAIEQANSPDLIPIQKAELKPGDLVFFNTLRHTFSHVGIYIGDDKFIHSPRAGGQVRVEDMRQAYWQQRFDGARRAPAMSAHQQTPPPNN